MTTPTNPPTGAGNILAHLFLAGNVDDSMTEALTEASHALEQLVLDTVMEAIGEEKPASASVYNAHYRNGRPVDTNYSSLELQLNNEMNKGYNQAIQELRTNLTAALKEVFG